MADEYTPTTEEIRAFATRLGGWTPEAFDRWLDRRDERVRTEIRDDLYNYLTGRPSHDEEGA